ncbi:MAG: Spy/CpxP family protein refolding chaperone [Gemmatimonadota bacterium]
MHPVRLHPVRRLITWAGLVAVLVLAATPGLAQDRMKGHDPEEHLARLQEELDLTAEQTEQIRAIFAEQHAKFQELRDEGGDREARREAFRQHREETHARLQAVLTEEQRARLEELHAEFKERHGHGPGGHEGHRSKDRPDNG